MPKVSVIIPCYNSEKTIRETLESVFAQNIQNFEIIIIDDGSSDGTKQIISEFGERVTTLYQDHQGPSAARNYGIREAKGEYLAFVDSDDLWLPEKLEKQLLCMQEKKVLWCYCDCVCFRDQDQKNLGRYSQLFYTPQEGWIGPELLMGNCIASPTPVIHRSLIDQCGTFDEFSNFFVGEDWEMWLRVAQAAEVVYLPDILAKYRVHTSSLSYAMDPQKNYTSCLAVIDKMTRLYPQDFLPIKDKATAHYAARISKSHWLRGDITEARKLIQQAVKLEPHILAYRVLQCLYGLPYGLQKFGMVIRQWLKGTGQG
jgi:glycosyltransferase involved in cell wall biosynthesis